MAVPWGVLMTTQVLLDREDKVIVCKETMGYQGRYLGFAGDAPIWAIQTGTYGVLDEIYIDFAQKERSSGLLRVKEKHFAWTCYVPLVDLSWDHAINRALLRRRKS